MNWIKDFVDLEGIDPIELIHRFSLSTAEVENEIYFKGKDISGIVVAEIKSVEEHPDSRKLHLLKVDAGDGKLTDVVCGAKNVRVGMKTAFAKIGAKIGDITISPRDLAGYTSYGMCCGESEIGLSDDTSGIMEITDDIPNGTDIKSVYDIEDIIFEVDNKSLTNRPDLWGHYGIAREFAALAKRPLKDLETVNLSAYDELPKLDMKILDPLCKRYSSIKIDNIKRNVSPVNVRIRLYYCGMRAINFLADLTNYIMLEMGQPMHAFDARKVEKIRIKRFEKPFTFTTLDKAERNIDEDTLMICSGETPVAIAGIMGGLDSEIVEDTTALTLESANFDAASIRKSSVRLSHRTDASMRYEKSLDPEMTVTAIGRFLWLLQKYDSSMKVVSSLTDEYTGKFPPVTLDFDMAFVDRYTGIKISPETITETLTGLGFKVKNNGDKFTVDVPSWRITKDVTMKADIIEEITRIYGYDNFEINTTRSPLYPVRMTEVKTDEEKIKDILVKTFGLHEVHSYVWAYNDEQKEIGIPVEYNVRLANATNPNIETLRNSIIPTQLCQVKSNVSYSSDFGIFEIGRVVNGLDENELCIENKMLAITLFSKTESIKNMYFELRDILSTLADDVKHCELEFRPIQPEHSYQHPVNLNRVIINNTEIGIIGLVYPTVAKNIDKKGNVVYAEIDVNKFAAAPDKGIVYEEPSKYPAIEYDISMDIPSGVYFSDIKQCWESVGTDLLKSVKVIDTYDTDTIHRITVRFEFSSNERTLSSAEIQDIIFNKVAVNMREKGIIVMGV